MTKKAAAFILAFACAWVSFTVCGRSGGQGDTGGGQADAKKHYREVQYSDGTFAYFQTGFWANNLNRADRDFGSPYAIFSGGLY